MKKLLAILLCMTLVLSFGACSSNDVATDETEVVEEKVVTITEAIASVEGLRNIQHRWKDANIWESVNDDYATLNIDTEDGVWNTDTTDKLNQLHSKLGFSGALLEKIKKTRGLDGTQTEENDNYKVTWSVTSPELNVTYEMK